MKPQTVYIETFGCQMNERDSEIMAQLLSEQDMHPAAGIDDADIVVVNTCSIRGKAEQKASSLLGKLRQEKEKRPALIIAVAGCVAQQEGRKMLAKKPFIDIVLGPQNIYRLPELVQVAVSQRQRQLATSLSAGFVIPPFLPTLESGSAFKRFITIMQGCNNFCTYCVVPYTRGREISREFSDIIEEVRHLAEKGVKEVTLLGQNVNSYAYSFADLLRAVSEVAGIERIRFTTSHPKDLSEELIRCFCDLEKLCGHLHLPVQSGSNRILKKMNRKYTVETYLEKVEKLLQYKPDIALTTDIIVGFPGETDFDFAATMELLETVRFHSAFSFKYSDRPAAKARDYPDKVPETVKSERLNIFQKRQEEISLERNRQYIGKPLTVMIEGESKNAAGQWSGRTTTNHIVNFLSPAPLVPGSTVKVTITDGCLNSLRGNLL